MELLIIMFIVLAVLALTRAASARQRTIQGAPRRPQVSAEQLAATQRAADEDVTALGEQLQALDVDLAGRPLDDATRADYQRALDAYEAAKESVQAIRVPDEVRNVTAILEDGRYAIACVRARASGQPLPPRRPPCFFNPQHGPSVRDVQWSPDGGAEREVPACALDAERVEAGAEPDSRQVMVGSRRVPYWEAGPVYAPWAAGYFGGFGLMNMMFMGTMMGTMWGGMGDDGSYGDGYGDGYDAGQDAGDGSDGSDGGDGGGGYDGSGSDGGYDGGGSDGGGYDASGDFGGGSDFGGFGGSDFGGSDFGGGDF